MSLTIEQALQQADLARKDDKQQHAADLYQAILQVKPNQPAANHALGVLAVSNKQVGTALPFLKAALQASPERPQFWFSYIDALIKAGQRATAADVIGQANTQGVTEAQLEALSARLIAPFPVAAGNQIKPPRQHLNRLLEAFQTARYGDAEKLARSITQDFPQYAFGCKLLGAVFKQTGRNADAVVANQTAVDVSPKDPEIHHNLGAAFLGLGA